MLITSGNFYKSWVTVMNNEKEALRKFQNSKKEYTRFVLESETGIIYKVTEYLSKEILPLPLKCYSYGWGYYFIDAVIYKFEDNIKPELKETWLKEIRVAIEHENDCSNLFEETSRLLTTNAELKVLITYAPSIEKLQDELNYIHKIVKETDDSEILSKNKSFLVIIGISNDLNFDWRGKIFAIDKWEDLT